MKNKIPPLLLTFGVVGLVLLSGKLLPAPFSWPSGFMRASTFFGLMGTVFVFSGVLAFRWAKTTMDPMNPERANQLVVSGVYRWSRNPMYVGFLGWLASAAALTQNLFAFAWLPLFVWYLTHFQIRPEEQALSTLFDQSYRDYMKRVPRWILFF